jgi:hypothetical protein
MDDVRVSRWSPRTRLLARTFTQALYDETQKDGWNVVSKNDWKRVFLRSKVTTA